MLGDNIAVASLRADTVLEFSGARVPVPDGHAASISVDLRLCEGEIAWVSADDEHQAHALADAASGLIDADEGVIRIGGLGWRELDEEQAAAMRGRIGRLLPPDQWAAHLSMADNIVLRPVHHTDRPFAEIRDDAAALARRFNLPGLPIGFPAEVPRRDLWPATLTRAFIDAPRLVIIEEMPQPIPQSLIPAAATAALAAAGEGAAVLWVSDIRHPAAPQGFARVARYRLSRGRLAPTGSGSLT